MHYLTFMHLMEIEIVFKQKLAYIVLVLVLVLVLSAH